MGDVDFDYIKDILEYDEVKRYVSDNCNLECVKQFRTLMPVLQKLAEKKFKQSTLSGKKIYDNAVRIITSITTTMSTTAVATAATVTAATAATVTATTAATVATAATVTATMTTGTAASTSVCMTLNCCHTNGLAG
jgi:hypothetical protein